MIAPAYYQSKIAIFLAADPDRILGELASNHAFALDITQRNAWVEQIANLKQQLQDFPDDEIFLEFAIPRMGRRVDGVLLTCGIICVLEYKVGAKTYDKHGIDQVTDYALDLKNFHEGSHDRYIAPILVSTKADKNVSHIEWSHDHVLRPLLSNGSDLGEVISDVRSRVPIQQIIDPLLWAHSGYKPTPTIVEAAQALYRGHSVKEISRSDAGAINLTLTSECICEIIDLSRKTGRKSICFVTGVPGSGKTLAGLNISVQRLSAGEEHAVFLSGNRPLVVVLREALTRDEVTRSEDSGQHLSKKAVSSKVSAFIQNVHHFRDEGIKSDCPPIEHVVVFDEAQRAWNQPHTEKFMTKKRGLAEFPMSEPEFLISMMDRRKDWCTIVCLIGGGQEINLGEAGPTEWLDALQKRFPHWDVYHSAQITQKEYCWGQDLLSKLGALRSQSRKALHLGVSIRSYRAEKLSAFVDSVIDGQIGEARSLLNVIREDYPVVITREIQSARQWLRDKARGTERFGLIASSGAIRLKPEGINVRAGIDPAIWFLNEKDDIRSSFYLEDAATEFDIQGLELDWTAVCWDADFRREGGEWALYNFKGTKWQAVNDQFRRIYLANAYRVLLTRARQGMVIFVPRGGVTDHTRLPLFYNGTYEFLLSCGIEEI